MKILKKFKYILKKNLGYREQYSFKSINSNLVMYKCINLFSC